MTITITVPTIADLTTAEVTGDGVFDVLMRANKAHLESEFQKGRIKGAEYATVYLGSLESVMTAALTFLLQKQKNALEAELIQQQILLAQAEVLKVNAQVNLSEQQTQNALAELAIIQANALKVPAEVALLVAQKDKVIQDTANAVVEGTVLVNQKLKLDAEIILIGKSGNKSDQETALLTQKVVTEAAQVSPTGVDADSVIGKQKALYSAQTSGFARDAEQKAAKLLADTWSVRRTTDEGTQADNSNMLDNGSIGRAISKMLAGIGA